MLAATDDKNLARVVGANTEEEPWFMVTEYSDMGDLNQFLQDHVAETTLSKSPGVATLRYVVGTRICSRLSINNEEKVWCSSRLFLSLVKH